MIKSDTEVAEHKKTVMASSVILMTLVVFLQSLFLGPSCCGSKDSSKVKLSMQSIHSTSEMQLRDPWL